MGRTLSVKVVLIVLIGAAHVSWIAAGDSFIELDQYYRMPRIYAYDDYDECFTTYESPDPAYCVARSVIKPDNRSELWRLIQDFSSDTYRHYRHDHLDRGLCVQRCRKLVASLDNETIQQLYVEKFDINFPYIIDSKVFEDVKVHQDRALYGRLINICENYILRKVYNLTAYTEIEYCTRPTEQIDVDFLDLSFLVVTMVLICLVITSTWFDSRMNKSKKNDHYMLEIPCKKTMIFTSFSLKRNWYRLISRSKDQLNEDLRFFQTFRFLTFLLVILGHCSDMFAVTPIGNTFDREREYYNPESLALINGSQIVQTFFQMSGFLLSIHFFTTRARLREVRWSVVLAVLVYRFIRLTPAYAYVLMLHATWLSKVQDGPLWIRGTQTEKYFCRKNWWTNLLYVNNYVNADQPCLQQAWYLACDFQLFTMGMILVVAVTKYPKLRTHIFSAAMFLAYLIPGLIVYFAAFDGAFINRLQDERFIYWFDRMYQLIYVPFHTNMGCYLGGIMLGMIYYKQRTNHHEGNRSWYLKVLWYLVVPVGFLCLMSNSIFYKYNFEKPAIWMAVFYPVMKHMWILLGAIMIYGIIYEYSKPIKAFLNFSIFVPLGRLTYCAYVCHVFMLKNAFFAMREMGYFSKMSLLSKMLTVLVSSYLMGLILALVLEFPSTAIQKHLFAKKLEEGEIFQVKKTSQSKKVMKSLDKERRRKKHAEKNGSSRDGPSYGGDSSSKSVVKSSSGSAAKDRSSEEPDKDKHKREKCEKSSSNIQTEIRTDDFVLVVKKSDPNLHQQQILNGRAALCAGRDDMSSEEEEEDESAGEGHHHRFAKPDNFKMYLENGVIPDAAMIHAARKRRQKAREQGDFIPVEEPKEDKSKKRVVREDGAGDGSDEDDDRIDMAAITGAKEREERREQFYSVQREDSAEDSDMETKEWENQQIRKGVTGAQLVSAHQESVISQYMIQGFSQSYQSNEDDSALSTRALLEQAYAKTSGLSKANTKASSAGLIARVATAGKDQKASGPRMPQEILKQLTEKLQTTKELNFKHITDIEKITQEVKVLKLDHLQSEQKAPVAAAKYRFYQEIKCYVSDLVECLDEKLPQIVALEQRAIATMAKYSSMLIERRRQDVRDQAKEMADANKGVKRQHDDPDRVRRAAEREGRRTRRRRDREKSETAESHLDGMSSDDEVADIEVSQYQASLKEIALEARQIFIDAGEEYCEVDEILDRFQNWRAAEMDSYKDAYVSLCLPKVLGPLIRLKYIAWNPVSGEDAVDFEREAWYRSCCLYGRQPGETESSLAEDPDVRLVPTLIEKIVLPKLTVLIEQVWDPLSTTQTLKLVRLINRLSRDYPSLRRTCKQLRLLFQAILDKLKLAIDNDVFIPVFPKQLQEAKSSFFQRQFCSGLKLLRNITCWQGVIADGPLTDLAIGSLLNRYLLNGMRVCTPTDAINKASMIVYTLPRVWLTAGSAVVQSMTQFIAMLQHVSSQLDPAIGNHADLIEKLQKILASLHVVS